ncbi:MAG TPA: hypothetical protein VJ877_03780, partial [Bacteroidales bacterium]|nr:hypothetical protein [Bacteroidales bacterium]
KNHLVMLDVFSNNHWKRPIYFSIGMEHQNFIGLENYLQLEGITYRLTPVKKTINDKLTGSINTDNHYNILMNKFIWTDYGDKLNISDYVIERDMYKHVVLRLLQALEAENKTDSATMVFDRYYELFSKE